MSGSPGDVQPVLEAVAERAAVLCEAPFARVLLIDGNVLRAVAAHSMDGSAQAQTVPLPLKRTSIVGRAVVDRATIHHADVVPLLESEYPGALNARRLGLRAVLAVPLMREGDAYGAIFLFRREPGLFSSDQVAPVETFARQAAISIDHTRLFNETKEALEQQTATSEILRVIASSPGDLKPMLHAVAERALRLCDAAESGIFLADGDALRFAAGVGRTPTFELGERLPLTRESITGRAVMDRAVINVEDVAAASKQEFPIARQLQTRFGDHAVLALPLMREDRAIGAFVLWRMEARRFTDKQVALVKTFADQAAIAIENVRLFNETKEALEQQTAISEILRVISSSPTNVQPVLDAVAERALSLCNATQSVISLVEGSNIRFAARFGTTRTYEGEVIPLSRGLAAGRAILDRTTIHLEDLAAVPEDEYPIGLQMQRVIGHRTLLAVPLMREDRAIGAISLWRMEVRPFTEKQIGLVKTFADQAAIAIENVRLFNETKEALERQTATSEILRVISQSPRDVQPVFDAIAAAALRLCNASSAGVLTFDGELMRLGALANVSPDEVDAVRLRYPKRPGRETSGGRAILTGSTVVVPEVLEDPEFEMRVRSFRSVVSVPLKRAGSPIGAITVGGPEPGRFPDTQIALLQTFADQAVIAIENVRLFTELEARTLQLTRSVEELKALGEVGQAVSSTLDLETVLSTIVSRATRLTGVDGGSIWEYDEAREEFHLHATDRLPNELVEVFRATPIRKGEGALGRLAMTGEPVEIRDIIDERSYQSRVRETLIRCGYRSVLAVPLLREGRLLGALAVNRNAPRRVRTRGDRVAEDFCHAVGSGDSECAPVPRD
jgi:GAF domain-containing protein